MSKGNIVERLRSMELAPCEEAADMLAFFFGQMQVTSARMNSEHTYRFRSSGWPMTHCKSPSQEAAARAAVAEIKRDVKVRKEQEA